MSSEPTRQSHGPNCACQNENVYKQRDELNRMQLEINDQALSPDELETKAVYCIQYLQAKDVPQGRRETVNDEDGCAHLVGFSQAYRALRILSKISQTLAPQNPSFTTRLVDAWPGIAAWLDYIAMSWAITPLFGFGSHNSNDVSMYVASTTVVASLRTFLKIPAFRERVLAKENGKAIYVILGSCWALEDTEDYKKALNADTAQDRFISAAEPILDLTGCIPGPLSNLFLGSLLPVGSKDMAKPARIALNHLAWYLDAPIPWSLSALSALDYHLRIVENMVISKAYLDALVAQQAVRSVARILVAATASPYNPGTATLIANVIAAAASCLNKTLYGAHGFLWVIHAIQVGLLPALLRAQDWVDDRDAAQATTGLLNLLAVYTIYPSVLRPLSASGRRVKELDLAAKIKDESVLVAYEEFVALLAERSEAASDLDIEMRCQNPKCRKIDAQGNAFSSCSGCFTVSYCSIACQKAHWKSGHKATCKDMKGLCAEGHSPSISDEDYTFVLGRIIPRRIRRLKDEIVAVWRADPPSQGPMLMWFSFDPDHPRGTAVADIDSFATRSPPLYAEPSVRARWAMSMAGEKRKEQIVQGVYLPFGAYKQLNFMWLSVNEEVPPNEGSVVERLIRTVEIM